MSAVEGHSIVWFNGVAYVFGGKNRRDEYINETWAVAVHGDNAVWTQVATHGDVPPPVAYHAAALWRDKYMLVIGGVSANPPAHGFDNMVHVLDLEQMVWRSREAVGQLPKARCHHTISVAPTQERLYLYGGYPVGPEGESLFTTGNVGTGDRPFFEIHELELLGSELRWGTIPCTEDFPPTLWGHSASLYYNNLIVFGGVDVIDNKETNLASVWQCDRRSWKWVEFNAAPPPRALHTAAVNRGCILTFGGFGATNTCKFNDVWSFAMDTGQWVEVRTGGDVPSARSGHAAVTDGRDCMYVIGGVDAKHERLNDVHVLHLPSATWQQLRTEIRGPQPAANLAERVPQEHDPEAPVDREEARRGQETIDRAGDLMSRAADRAGEYLDMKNRLSQPAHVSPQPSAPTQATPQPSMPPIPGQTDPSALHPQPSALHFTPVQTSTALQRTPSDFPMHDPSGAPPPPPPYGAHQGTGGPRNNCRHISPSRVAAASPPYSAMPGVPPQASYHDPMYAPQPTAESLRQPSGMLPVQQVPSMASTALPPYPPAPASRQPSGQMLYPGDASRPEEVVPYTDPMAFPEDRNASPMRSPAPPPPPPLNHNRSHSAAETQGVQTDPMLPVETPHNHAPSRFPAKPVDGDKSDKLTQEAADIIQKQRVEINLLRDLLEREKNKHEGPGDADDEYGDLAGLGRVPPAPAVGLTKDTIADLMPRLNLNLVDTPVLKLPTKGKRDRIDIGPQKDYGLMSRQALQDIIDRRIRGGEGTHLSMATSPLINPQLLSTAPTDTSRYTIQRKDMGQRPSATTAVLADIKPSRPRDGLAYAEPEPGAPPEKVDILDFNPLKLLGINPASVSPHRSPPSGKENLPAYHPSNYQPPRSYAELMARSGHAPPAPASDAPSGAELPYGVPPAKPHKSPSLNKILKGGSMLSISHVPDA